MQFTCVNSVPDVNSNTLHQQNITLLGRCSYSHKGSSDLIMAPSSVVSAAYAALLNCTRHGLEQMSDLEASPASACQVFLGTKSLLWHYSERQAAAGALAHMPADTTAQPCQNRFHLR